MSHSMSDLKQHLDSIQKKAKERTVKTQTIEYDLETLVKKIKRGVIKLNPEYQRKHRWLDDVSSKLIESLILNIPIPVVYISQDIDVDTEVDDDISRYSVIDGQQRLTAISNFFNNKYPLIGLDTLSELNNSFYKDLPPFLVRRLEERTIKCLRIDSTADTQVKYDIFERLNSGSVKLEAQELRNATCRGPFKRLIKELAKDKIFVNIARLNPDSARVKKMEDEELVLRFFSMTYKQGYRSYKGKFKQFLTNKMDYFNSLDSETLLLMKESFIETMKKIHTCYGDTPFSKYKFKDDELSVMSSFNVAVFDSIVYPFSILDSNREPKYENFKDLFKDPEFFTLVEGSVNDVAKVTKRIEKSLKVIV